LGRWLKNGWVPKKAAETKVLIVVLTRDGQRKLVQNLQKESISEEVGQTYARK